MRKKDDCKRQKIKEAVLQEIRKNGFQGASIAKIAKTAGVSPATVYIYYENKEEMLKDIYHEYAEQVFEYVLADIHKEMSGEEILAKVIRNYYEYATLNHECFLFVEQFVSCPSLLSGCGSLNGMHRINQLFAELRGDNIIGNWNDETVYAIIFSPVGNVVARHSISEEKRDLYIEQIIEIVKKGLA